MSKITYGILYEDRDKVEGIYELPGSTLEDAIARYERAVGRLVTGIAYIALVELDGCDSQPDAAGKPASEAHAPRRTIREREL